MELIILLIIALVLAPILRVLFTVFRTAHTVRKEFKRQSQQFSGNQSQQQAWHSTKQPKQKVSIRDKVRAYYKNAGEYVDFEEIKDDSKK